MKKKNKTNIKNIYKLNKHDICQTLENILIKIESLDNKLQYLEKYLQKTEMR